MGEDSWAPVKNPFITLIPNAREYNLTVKGVGWSHEIPMNGSSIELLDGAIKTLMSIKNLIAYKLDKE
jgi:hypothetical protein